MITPLAEELEVGERGLKALIDYLIEGGSLEAKYQLAPLRMAFTLGSYPTVIKESLSSMGIETGPCMGPIEPMSPGEKSQ
jgi:dihydrodipicolinate synthase/N-acetylneuraminate lyase